MLKLLRRFNLWEYGNNISFRTKCSSSSKMNAPNTNLDLEVDRIVWIDMEMTGLDVENDKIMEVACLVTDSNLNIIAEAPDLIIHQSQEVLDNMNDWCKVQHAKTGLTEACQKSTTSIAEAEQTLLSFLKEHTTVKSSPLGGNSVYMDRKFLDKFMKSVDDHLHYRIIDVSTVKELCRRWNLGVYKSQPKKEFNHRAITDIKESIQELQFYRKNFLKTSTN